MPRDIKFTSFGVPYVLEFENVSFAPERASFLDESFCYIETPPPSPRSPFTALFTRRKPSQTDPVKPPSPPPPPPPPPPPKSDSTDPHGIFIQFPPEHCHLHLSRKQRLIHLQRTITIAVLDAGMSRSPGNTALPENHPSNNPSNRSRGNSSADALFSGTYGQLMAALEGAGLSATPCVGDRLSGHTRLGALFVARNNGTSGVQLRKITLWG